MLLENRHKDDDRDRDHNGEYVICLQVLLPNMLCSIFVRRRTWQVLIWLVLADGGFYKVLH